MLNSENYLKVEECEDRAFYRVDGRNFNLGISVKGGTHFLGLRYKFGYFVTEEVHYDEDDRCGTVQPLEKLKYKVPDDMDLENYHNNKDLFDLFMSTERTFYDMKAYDLEHELMFAKMRIKELEEKLSDYESTTASTEESV